MYVAAEIVTDRYLTRIWQSYLRVQTRTWLVGLQEIMQALVIDLYVAHAYPAVPIIWGPQLGSLGKQVLQGPRDQTRCVIVSI